MTEETFKKRILLADDDAAMRRFLEVLLRRADYDVKIVEDGGAALQCALTEEFEIFLFDAMMPNLTGNELCRICKQHSQIKEIPIVILSGMESEVNADADAQIVKNANLQHELLQTLARLLTK